jgi:hypothetical protein
VGSTGVIAGGRRGVRYSDERRTAAAGVQLAGLNDAWRPDVGHAVVVASSGTRCRHRLIGGAGRRWRRHEIERCDVVGGASSLVVIMPPSPVVMLLRG